MYLCLHLFESQKENWKVNRGGEWVAGIRRTWNLKKRIERFFISMLHCFYLNLWISKRELKAFIKDHLLALVWCDRNLKKRIERVISSRTARQHIFSRESQKENWKENNFTITPLWAVGSGISKRELKDREIEELWMFSPEGISKRELKANLSSGKCSSMKFMSPESQKENWKWSAQEWCRSAWFESQKENWKWPPWKGPWSRRCWDESQKENWKTFFSSLFCSIM